MSIDEIRDVCKKLPAVTEDVKWGHDLCFLVGSKMFCVAGLDNELKVSVKVTPEEFDGLCERSGVIPAPYMARHKWVLVNSGSFSSKEWKHYIAQSYELVKEKLAAKMKRELFGLFDPI